MRYRKTHWLRVYGLCCVSLALVLGTVTTSDAEPLGGPANLEKGQWAMAVGGGGIRKRAMKGGAKASVFQVGHFRGYGLTDRLALYGNIGAAYVTVDDSSVPSRVGTGFGTNLIADLQLKMKFWESVQKGWEWDGSARYTYVGAPHKRNNNQASWNEEEFATTIAKSFGALTPYAGVKLSLLQFDYKFRSDQFSRDGRYKPDGIVGPLVGFNWEFGESKSTVLNIEGTYVGGFGVIVALMKKY